MRRLILGGAAVVGGTEVARLREKGLICPDKMYACGSSEGCYDVETVGCDVQQSLCYKADVIYTDIKNKRPRMIWGDGMWDIFTQNVASRKFFTE